jgi:hypothetical protein
MRAERQNDRGSGATTSGAHFPNRRGPVRISASAVAADLSTLWLFSVHCQVHIRPSPCVMLAAMRRCARAARAAAIFEPSRRIRDRSRRPRGGRRSSRTSTLLFFLSVLSGLAHPAGVTREEGDRQRKMWAAHQGCRATPGNHRSSLRDETHVVSAAARIQTARHASNCHRLVTRGPAATGGRRPLRQSQIGGADRPPGAGGSAFGTPSLALGALKDARGDHPASERGAPLAAVTPVSPISSVPRQPSLARQGQVCR